MAGILLQRKPWLLAQALEQLTQWPSAEMMTAETEEDVPWLPVDVAALFADGGRLPVAGQRRHDVYRLKQLGHRRTKGARFAQIVQFQYPKQDAAAQQDSSAVSCELSDGRHCVWALLDPQAVQCCLERANFENRSIYSQKGVLINIKESQWAWWSSEAAGYPQGDRQHQHRLLIHRLDLVGGEECQAVGRELLLALEKDKVWLEQWGKLVERLDPVTMLSATTSRQGVQGIYEAVGNLRMTLVDSQNTQMTGVHMIMEQFTPSCQFTASSQEEDGEVSMLLPQGDGAVASSTDDDDDNDPWKNFTLRDEDVEIPMDQQKQLRKLNFYKPTRKVTIVTAITAPVRVPAEGAIPKPVQRAVPPSIPKILPPTRELRPVPRPVVTSSSSRLYDLIRQKEVLDQVPEVEVEVVLPRIPIEEEEDTDPLGIQEIEDETIMNDFLEARIDVDQGSMSVSFEEPPSIPEESDPLGIAEVKWSSASEEVAATEEDSSHSFLVEMVEPHSEPIVSDLGNDPGKEFAAANDDRQEKSSMPERREAAQSEPLDHQHPASSATHLTTQGSILLVNSQPPDADQSMDSSTADSFARIDPSYQNCSQTQVAAPMVSMNTLLDITTDSQNTTALDSQDTTMGDAEMESFTALGPPPSPSPSDSPAGFQTQAEDAPWSLVAPSPLQRAETQVPTTQSPMVASQDVTMDDGTGIRLTVGSSFSQVSGRFVSTGTTSSTNRSMSDFLAWNTSLEEKMTPIPQSSQVSAIRTPMVLLSQDEATIVVPTPNVAASSPQCIPETPSFRPSHTSTPMSMEQSSTGACISMVTPGAARLDSSPMDPSKAPYLTPCQEDDESQGDSTQSSNRSRQRQGRSASTERSPKSRFSPSDKDDGDSRRSSMRTLRTQHSLSSEGSAMTVKRQRRQVARRSTPFGSASSEKSKATAALDTIPLPTTFIMEVAIPAQDVVWLAPAVTDDAIESSNVFTQPISEMEEIISKIDKDTDVEEDRENSVPERRDTVEASQACDMATTTSSGCSSNSNRNIPRSQSIDRDICGLSLSNVEFTFG